MSNFTIENPLVTEPIAQVEIQLEDPTTFLVEQPAAAYEPTQTEQCLGVLARRAATADYYSHLTESRESTTETVTYWKSQHEHWIDEAEKLIELNPQSIFKFFMTYEGVISNLNNPNR